MLVLRMLAYYNEVTVNVIPVLFLPMQVKMSTVGTPVISEIYLPFSTNYTVTLYKKGFTRGAKYSFKYTIFLVNCWNLTGMQQVFLTNISQF